MTPPLTLRRYGRAAACLFGAEAPRTLPFRMLPLTGTRVLLLRPEAQDVGAADPAASAGALFRAKGAEVTQIALARLAPPTDGARFAQARKDAASGAYAWVVFTSVHGVTRFCAALRDDDADALQSFSHAARIACIGAVTANALEPFGLAASLVAEASHGEGLAEAMLSALGTTSQRVLLARAEVARNVLPEALRAAGHHVDDVAVYRSELAADRAPDLAAWLARDAKRQGPHIVVFSSPNSVDAFLTLGGTAARGAEASPTTPDFALSFASIGPATTARCRERHLEVLVEANPSTFPALAEALERHFLG